MELTSALARHGSGCRHIRQRVVLPARDPAIDDEQRGANSERSHSAEQLLGAGADEHQQ